MVRAQLVTIRSKLLVLIAAAVLLAQVIAASLSLWQEAHRYGEQKRETLIATAQVLAAAAAPSVADADAPGAYGAIRAIGRIRGLRFVGITTKDGKPFVDLGATDQLESDLVFDDASPSLSIVDLARSRSLEAVVPVVQAGVRVGMLHLVADTSDLPTRLWAALGTTSLGGMAGLIVALVFALQLQRGITDPLRRLTSIMRRVRESHDYSATMTQVGNDEVGVLAGGFNAMIGDIRARDQKIALHLEQLEQEVGDRTRDFQLAASEALSANRAKSDFLATMSHEIRTPMNGVLVMAELLAACDLPAKARRHADVIVKSGQSLLAIINDILDLSKIEAGRLEVEKLDVEPGECSETVLRLFAERARQKGLDLSARIRLKPGTLVEADPVRLGQVLSNLVNNALKFTERGCVVLELAEDPDDAGRVRFSVIDTGIGIGAEKLDTIFDAFAQADQTTTRRFGGTGLGLAIGKRLVAAMGGDLCVKSEPERGSTFSFSLPVSRSSDARLLPGPFESEGAPGRRAVVCVPGAATTESALLYLGDVGFDAHSCEVETLMAACRQASLVMTTPEILRGFGRPETLTGGLIVALADAGYAGDDLIAAKIVDLVLHYPLSRAEVHEIGHGADALRRLGEDVKAPKRDALPDFTGVRILVADDSAVNREVAEEALKRFGVRATLVASGGDAVEAVRSGSYDLILMDGSMPDIDGFEATRLIREIERAGARPRVPIIALTAHVVGTGADAWREAGMDDILHKPYTLAKLAACLSRNLATKRQAQATEEDIEPKTTHPSATGLLDPRALEGLREMSGGAADLVERVARLYRERAPMRIAELREAIERSQFRGAAAAAHALKSMSLNIGAQAVAEAAAKIEYDAHNSHALVTTQVVEELNSLAERTCALLVREAA